MKQQDSSRMQTPTEALNQALQGLNKVGVPFLSDEETSSELSEQTEQTFREGLMQEILEDHPGLTPEELEAQMRASGF